MAINISCKFEKASYNIFFVRAVTVKSLYTLRRRHNEVKSIVSTGCYPVDTMMYPLKSQVCYVGYQGLSVFSFYRKGKFSSTVTVLVIFNSPKLINELSL